jgi:hypothetical protein
LPIPTPEPGLVIPYVYLWRHEHRKGQEKAVSPPSVIVLAVQSPGRYTRVTVAPITYIPPAKDGEAIELLPRVKQALGLVSTPG